MQMSLFESIHDSKRIIDTCQEVAKQVASELLQLFLSYLLCL